MKLHITSAVITLLLATNVHAQERDPFTPYGSSATTTTSQPISQLDDGNVVNPLTTFPLNSFRLAGIMTSPTQSIAIVTARNGKDYFINKGDKLGAEKAEILTINRDGITVKLKSDTILVPVNNKLEKTHDESK